MSRLSNKRAQSHRRKNRVRSIVRGSSSRPRLSVFVSNQAIYVQIIDDEKGVTLASANSQGMNGTLTEQATSLGTQIAKNAKDKKIKQVSFDRGSKLYHGRIKALAESARKEGLQF